ncbi:TIGR01777 family oxidoreductase [Alicyclobacillus mengziensis]|uniref:TIGR01777 family oxidoreductase n=1 Tax=Alicyclobacillus mengziensis TaxID=2931921 RepID=A0A9X7VY41_9BACL|nr:TIGR01777 family oxidoreductase [Alicyclobacillus mengziensis]QSO46829.1 TIGR01777 family oxidoreductase [Alicyclobacillus mengziensis]
MDVVIFGGSGLIGQALAATVEESGGTAFILSRSRQLTRYGTTVPYSLETLHQVIGALPIDGPYAIVNLAGESIAGGRWTTQRKQAIRDSRVILTEALANAIRNLEVPPSVFVSGSAVGYYGTSTTATFTESNLPGDGFLTDVTCAWEDAAQMALPATRVVLLRTGVVLAANKGALAQMALPYRFFAGGRVGSGLQWVSWIHIADVSGMILHCINNEEIYGPVNVTAPNPVQMDEFGKSIAIVLRRPHFMPVPSGVMRALLGEMSQIMLEGQRVLPEKALDTGYVFMFPEVRAALFDLLSPNRHPLSASP